jgi:translation elongation factor EF-1beta
MKKNNTKVSQRGLKRHQKNVQRKKRSEELKKFNDIAFRVKTIQAYMKQMEEKTGIAKEPMETNENA